MIDSLKFAFRHCVHFADKCQGTSFLVPQTNNLGFSP